MVDKKYGKFLGNKSQVLLSKNLFSSFNKVHFKSVSLLRIAVFTLVELTALVLWLMLLTSDKPLIAAAVLAVGLTIEHSISFSKSQAKLLGIIGVSVSESVIWIVWFLITSNNNLLALLVLSAFMLIQHLVERNVFLGKSLFNFSDILKVVGFTLFESVGAAIWFILVSIKNSRGQTLKKTQNIYSL